MEFQSNNNKNYPQNSRILIYKNYLNCAWLITFVRNAANPGNITALQKKQSKPCLGWRRRGRLRRSGV
jgi:hypothetical protein